MLKAELTLYSGSSIAMEEGGYDPSPDPSLVPVPVALTTLAGASVDAYSRPWKKDIMDHPHNHEDEGDEVCAVCLDNLEVELELEESDKQVRELTQNCGHLFHKGCLDAWVGRGNVTCPVCRAKLLGDHKEARKDLEFGGDPWRLERMIYLFGEDVLF